MKPNRPVKERKEKKVRKKQQTSGARLSSYHITVTTITKTFVKFEFPISRIVSVKV